MSRLTITSGQITKHPRVTIGATSEEAFDVSLTGTPHRVVARIRPMADVLLHHVAGQAATDGYPILAGTTFEFPINSATVFYLYSVAGSAVDITTFA
jgi:hypothetical protein